jgi:CMP-N-acetylneuraminic acid synthetase
MKIISLIPARIGSQRLNRKNLRLLKGMPLIQIAIQKVVRSGVFEEIWVSSDSEEISQIAGKESALFHKRPAEFANSTATSEEYLDDFLKDHVCDWIVQVHSIAPLLSVQEIVDFVDFLKSTSANVVLGYVPVKLECVLNERPLNFSFDKKTNSQELEFVKKISWSISAWKRDDFLEARRQNKCATYYGKVDYFELDALSGMVIKTEFDLKMIDALYKLKFGHASY